LPAHGLWALAYPDTSLLVIFIALTALGGLIELVQGTALINREASLADWGADILGVLAVLIGFALQRAACSAGNAETLRAAFEPPNKPSAFYARVPGSGSL
jgi:hypothetical protein